VLVALAVRQQAIPDQTVGTQHLALLHQMVVVVVGLGK
jgi:hypothetical protein